MEAMVAAWGFGRFGRALDLRLLRSEGGDGMGRLILWPWGRWRDPPFPVAAVVSEWNRPALESLCRMHVA
ncbi:MAG: hypothetical protein C4321_02940 [Chloroflexota bacterium]